MTGKDLLDSALKNMHSKTEEKRPFKTEEKCPLCGKTGGVVCRYGRAVDFKNHSSTNAFIYTCSECNSEWLLHQEESTDSGKGNSRAIISFPGVKNKILEKLNKMQRTHSLTLEKLIRDPYVSSIMIAIRYPFPKENIKDLEKYLKDNNILLKYKINDYSKLAPNVEDVYHEVLIEASILNFTNNCLFTFRIRLVNQNDKFITKKYI